jgi:antitoxin (DNA-binding transcriptional repressor) of toxin-antitoxin stability system
MKTMTEGDVREHWGETLASLATEKEVLITSGDRVVARLVAEEAETPRKRFDPEEHRKWMEEVWGDETFDSLPGLLADREDRVLISPAALKTLADERPRFDPEKNRKRREKLWGKGVVIDTLSGLLEDREDRKLL